MSTETRVQLGSVAALAAWVGMEVVRPSRTPAEPRSTRDVGIRFGFPSGGRKGWT